MGAQVQLKQLKQLTVWGLLKRHESSPLLKVSSKAPLLQEDHSNEGLLLGKVMTLLFT